MNFADEILNKVIAKTEVTHKRIGASMPYTTDENGFYDDRSINLLEGWTNGFYPGMLWYLYEYTGNESYKEYAVQIEEKLFDVFKKPTSLHHDMGFMFLPTSVKNFEMTGDEAAKERALLAACVLASRYNIKAKFIRAWQGDGEKKKLGIIDCMMNIPLLYWASIQEDDDRYKHIADSFAHTVIKSHIREDGSSNHIIAYNLETGEVETNYGGQGYCEGSSWSRGQAWALYGFIQCFNYTKNIEYLNVAKKVANYFITALGDDYIPKCDFHQPKEPHIVDTTAGVIAASGFIDIAGAVDESESEFYMEAATRILKAYDEKVCNYGLDSEELVPMGTEAYHKKDGIHIPIIYGDYYFVESLCKLAERNK